MEHLTENVSFFPVEQKQMRALEACESALSSKWTPPLQVDIVLDPLTYFFYFNDPICNPSLQEPAVISSFYHLG